MNHHCFHLYFYTFCFIRFFFHWDRIEKDNKYIIDEVSTIPWAPPRSGLCILVPLKNEL